MSDVRAALVAHRVFAGLDGEHLDVLAACGHLEAASSGAMLFREGRPADRCFALQTGRVALSLHAPGRGDLVFDTSGPGDVVGFSWLFPPHVWQCDARVVDDATFAVIDGACVLERIEADPRLGLVLMWRIAEVMHDLLHHAEVRMLDLYGRSRA